LSVHAYEAARHKAAQAGVDGFIVKGAPVETLVRAIIEKKEDIERNEIIERNERNEKP
jgi:DNA-binding NarL/FixJ family response regulator